MPSIYVKPEDYAQYGIDSTTPESQIIRAGNTINAFLDRPEGLLYGVDGSGNPCYMLALEPSVVLQVVGIVAPGTSVDVTVSTSSSSLQIGKVLTFDRANISLTESVIVTNVVDNVITLKEVKFTHSNGALLEFDLCIDEEKNMPDDRQEVVLNNAPIAAILAAQGQFGYSRRGSSINYNNEISLLPLLNTFSGSPVWQSFTISANSYDSQKARVWINPSIYLSNYTQVRISYIAGWTYRSLPSQIKTAVASIVSSYNFLPDFPVSGRFKKLKQGDTEVELWGDTILDTEIKSLLSPFMANFFV